MSDNNVKEKDLEKVSGGFGGSIPGPYKFTNGERIYVDQSHMGYYMVLEDVDTEDEDYIVHCNTYFHGILKSSNIVETAGHLATIRKYFG